MYRYVKTAKEKTAQVRERIRPRTQKSGQHVKAAIKKKLATGRAR